MALSPDERSLEDLIASLPPELRGEVEDFARLLLAREPHGESRHLGLEWAGGLREFRDEFTSLELEKRALDWWGS